MAQRRFDKGAEAFGTALVNASTGTFKAMLLTLSTTSNAVKAISAATNASPINVTATAHGFTTGDIVVIRGVGGNTAANGTWKIANVTTNAFDLTTVAPQGGTSLNSTGNAAYTSGGTAINLTSLAIASTDISAGRVTSTTDATLSSVTYTKGILSCASPIQWTNVPATSQIDGLAVYQSASTDRVLGFFDGKIQVRVDAAASSSATSITVEPLPAGIANGTVLVFSNGVSATLSAQANAGDRALTVSALSAGIAIGHTADAPVLNANFPMTTGSTVSTIQYNVDATYGLMPT